MQANKVLINEVTSLQKMVKAQNQVHSELISHLSTIDERRRNSRHSAHSSHSSHSGQFHSGSLAVLPDSTDEPPAELRRARDILSGISSDPTVDKEFEKLIAIYQTGSPPDSAASSTMVFNPPSMPVVHDPLNDPRHLVYPVGQIAGIDPFHADHINNIPYTRPLGDPNAMAEASPQVTPPPSKGASGSLWTKKPTILLVEDDRVCARIGEKFLKQVDCEVHTAVSPCLAVVVCWLLIRATGRWLRSREQSERRPREV